jgi:glycyl-tRNA synthetase beta chain
MVGEFPELQGVMGRYYALAQGEDARVAEAIAAHYRPAGAGDAVPNEPIAIAVALADKLQTIAAFFAIGEKPTGSGDPFALRRAALGVIRIIRENGLRLPLRDATTTALIEWGDILRLGLDEIKQTTDDVLAFFAERLRVQMRAEGQRYDVVDAAFAARGETGATFGKREEGVAEDDLNRLLFRAHAVRGFVESEAGANLLAAHRRAVNILRIEEKRDGHAFDTGYEAHLLKLPEEAALAAALEEAGNRIRLDIEAEDFERAMEAMAGLRGPVDAFFEKVIVNDPAPELRRNRLRLLARLRAAMDAVADFSKIEA